MSQRVLHIHFGKEGGAERFFTNLATALAEDGVEQRFVIRPGRSWDADIARLGPVHRTNFRPLEFWSRLWAQRRIARWCRDWKPDAVMAWMVRASQAVPAGHDGLTLLRLGDFPQDLDHFDAMDLIVGNTPEIAARLSDLGWQKGRAVVSNFPRELAISPVPRAAHDTPETVPLLVTGGRFVPRKGMDLAIRVAARIPGLYLWLVGDGKERAALEALAQELGVADRTRFVGWVDEPIHHIASGDVFLLPSRVEPLGNVLLEAWRAGVPSVSTRCEGPSWYMRDEVDGLMAPIDGVAEAATAVGRLLDDRDMARAMAQSASRRLEEMFSRAGVSRQYRELFALSPSEARALRPELAAPRTQSVSYRIGDG